KQPNTRVKILIAAVCIPSPEIAADGLVPPWEPVDAAGRHRPDVHKAAIWYAFVFEIVKTNRSNNVTAPSSLWLSFQINNLLRCAPIKNIDGESYLMYLLKRQKRGSLVAIVVDTGCPRPPVHTIRLIWNVFGRVENAQRK